MTRKWPVLHASGIPQFDPATWRLRVTGLVREQVELTWPEFSRMQKVSRQNDIHCVTRWTMLDNVWEGVRAADLLAIASIDRRARFAVFHAPGYSANLPLSVALDEDTLIATHHNGEPLSLAHGAPARVVVPSRYFWKSVKWVMGIELLAEDEPGYWERLGYHNDGKPFSEERFAE